MADSNPFSAFDAADKLRRRGKQIDAAIEGAQRRPPRSEADAGRARRVRPPAAKLTNTRQVPRDLVDEVDRMRNAQSNPGN